MRSSSHSNGDDNKFFGECVYCSSCDEAVGIKEYIKGNFVDKIRAPSQSWSKYFWISITKNKKYFSLASAFNKTYKDSFWVSKIKNVKWWIGNILQSIKRSC